MARSLSFTVQPTDSLAGGVIVPAPRLEILNEGILDRVSGPVSLSLSPNSGGSVLGGEIVRNADGGIVEFPGLWLDKTAAGYKLLASVDESRLRYSGAKIDPDVFKHWRFRNTAGAIAPYDTLSDEAFDRSGPEVANYETTIGPAGWFPSQSTYFGERADGSEATRLALMGDLTVAILARTSAAHVFDRNRDMASYAGPTEAPNGVLFGAYLRRITGTGYATAWYWDAGGVRQGPGLTPAISPGWFRLVMVRKITGSTAEAITYVNGVEVERAGGLAPPSGNDGKASRFWLGMARPYASGIFQGSIAEVAFVKRAWSPAEVAEDSIRCGLPFGLNVVDAKASWTFDANANAADQNGNRALTWAGNATLIEDGPIGPAARSEEGAQSTWLSLTPTTFNAGTPRTILVLARPGAARPNNRIAGGVTLSTGLLRLGAYINTAGAAAFRIGSAEVVVPGPFTEGPWALFGVTQAADGSGIAYLNGVAVGTAKAAAEALAPIQAGCNTTRADYWTGGLAAMALWDRVLSPAEMLDQAKRCRVA